ncbi:MAG: hypothetical protein GX957_05670 [Clostridiaceae bacterium]|nr:hypothetical protein [Clostridiaceae bacterium]
MDITGIKKLIKTKDRYNFTWGRKLRHTSIYITFAIIILSVIFTPLSIAATKDSELTDEIYITYNSIEDTVKENNLQLKLSNITLNRLKRDFNSSDENIDEAKEQLLNMIRFITGVSKDVDAVFTSNPPVMPGNGGSDESEALSKIHDNQMELYNNLLSVAAATKLSLQIAQENLNAQIQNLNTSTDGMKEQIELTEMNIKQVENTLINSAKNLFLIYHQLNINLGQLENSQKVLERQLSSSRVHYDQGLIKQEIIMDLETSLLELKASQRSLQNQRDVILLQVKNILGFTYRDDVYLGQIPLLGTAFIKTIDFDSDVKEALKGAMSLDIKKKELDNASIWGYRRDYELQIKEDEAYLAFLKQYQSLLEKNDILLIAESKLANAQLKLKSAEESFKKGLISQNDLETLKSDVKAKEFELKSNAIALICEIENYKAMKAGSL